MRQVFVTANAPGWPPEDVRAPGDVPAHELAPAVACALGWRCDAGQRWTFSHAEQGDARTLLLAEQSLDQAGIWDGAHVHLTCAPERLLPIPPSSDADTGQAQPFFQRPPRPLFQLAAGEIELAAPPNAPSAPRLQWPGIVLPAAFAIASLAATLSAPHVNGPMNFLTTGFMGMSALAGLWTYASERRRYSHEMAERSARYGAYLEQRRAHLAAQANRLRVESLDEDPDLHTMLGRVRKRARVWMREPGDPDYLQARIGLGRVPAGMTIKTARYEPLLAPDVLADRMLELAEAFAAVERVPLCVPVGQLRGLGLAGPRTALLRACHALAAQMAAHHSPDDLALAAIFPAAEADKWRWLRWLPHAWDAEHRHRLLACDADGAKRALDAVLLAAQRPPASAQRPRHTLLFLAESDLSGQDAALSQLLALPLGAGVTAVFLAGDRHALPRECDAYVTYDAGRARLFTTTDNGHPRHLDSVDALPGQECDALARSLAAIRLRRTAAPAEIPSRVSLLSLWDARRVEDVNVAALWRSHAHLDAGSLAVPIGRAAGGRVLQLDLRDGDRGHGAHGLVAGTTGAGKSELLQTLIASLAVRFSPEWISFLLIDYKGGGMANAFLRQRSAAHALPNSPDLPNIDLPHLSGVITNLFEPSAARRALIALDSELKRRQRIFDHCGVTYIDDYQRLYAAGGPDRFKAMPRLVIIVDEFAELKRDQPDFMKQLISAARIGRSLGVHLILATQKPSGVVDDQIWSNSRFKLCLRVQDESDSKEMLKRADAAHLARAGEAYFLVGSAERYERFQSAFGGARYEPDDDPDAAQRFVAVLLLDGTPDPLRRCWIAQSQAPRGERPSQLAALMDHVRRTTLVEQVRAADRIWLDPLPERLLLEPPAALGQSRGWLRASIGRMDDPRERRQDAALVDLGRDGHLMIFGQAGAGKSTLLQTLLLALARAHSPAELNAYVLDFGSRSLAALAALPQVGAVLFEDDDERLMRLFRQLRFELIARKDALAGRKFADLGASAGMPAIVLVIDNYPAFARLDYEDMLVTLVRDGAPLGMHVVISANKPLDVRSRVSGNITSAIAFQLADRSDYAAVVGRTGGMEPAALPGRGLIKRMGHSPLEFQAALPAPGATDAERAAHLADVAGALCAEHAGRRAPPIAVMPAELTLRSLLTDAPHARTPGDRAGQPLVAAVGLQTVDLQPLRIDVGASPHVLVTGTPQSGKTSVLQSMLLSLARTRDPEQLMVYLCDVGGAEDGLAALAGLPHVRQCAQHGEDVSALIDELAATLDSIREMLDAARAAAPDSDATAFACSLPAVVLVIDDADAFVRVLPRPARERLDGLLDRASQRLPFHVLIAGPDRTLDAMDGWLKRIKDSHSWVVLGGLQSVGFGLRLPVGERDKPLQAGHGYYICRRQPRPVRARFAMPQEEGWRWRDWLSTIGQAVLKAPENK